MLLLIMQSGQFERRFVDIKTCITNVSQNMQDSLCFQGLRMTWGFSRSQVGLGVGLNGKTEAAFEWSW